MKKTEEEKRLQTAKIILNENIESFSPMLQQELLFLIMEKVSSLYSGVLFKSNKKSVFKNINIDIASKKVFEAILDSQVDVPLAISALLGPVSSWHTKKTSGQYYTDFRLANFLAKANLPYIFEKSKIIDPSCGSGILLTAQVLALFPNACERRNKFLESNVFGADLSENALKSALISLASLGTKTLDLDKLKSNLVCIDSIDSNQTLIDLAPEGFSLVIGNPPWERLKISFFEELKKYDQKVVYGDQNKRVSKSSELILTEKQKLEDYIKKIKKEFKYQGKGESDLYKFFTELSFNLIKDEGRISLIIPGGFIRSQGTEPLRKHVLQSSNSVSISFLDNKKAFFNIDSRFKFIVLTACKLKNKNKNEVSNVEINFPRVTENFIDIKESVSIKGSELFKLRSDYSIPEVRNLKEMKLYQKISKTGIPMDSSSCIWKPIFCREVDMTSDKVLFSSECFDGHIPVIEGRMVHQYTYNSKSYKSGSGRSAEWDLSFFSRDGKVNSQYWFPKQKLSTEIRKRIEQRRIGFCDITGQTNERTMLASWIPENVVCGNKVPTILFDGDNEKLSSIWLGIVNSFVFDWLLRRTVTTTVNYFILTSIPLPNIDFVRDKKLLKKLEKEVEDISDSTFSTLHEYQIKRAKIESIVATLYNLTDSDLKVVFEDFPLIDKIKKDKYPSKDSSITKDLILQEFSLLNSLELCAKASYRLKEAKKENIIGFIPFQAKESVEKFLGEFQ